MVAYLFPGQGSQRPGMGADLVANSRIAGETFDEASAAAETDLRRLCFDASEEELRRTENAQVALFTCGVAAYRVAREAGAPAPAMVAGHSVGEYAALVVADVLTLDQGVRAVMRRGQLMAQSGTERRGTMAAVLGLDVAMIEQACSDIGHVGTVVVANDNSPGQIVISGDFDAVQAASALLGDRGAKRVLPLNVSGAFHSPLMADSAAAMGQFLESLDFRVGQCPVVANVTAQPVTDPSGWPSLLEKQLASPVRWRESILTMRALGVSRFVECGVGEVLCGLVRRIDPEAQTAKVVDMATAKETVSALGEVPA